MRMRCVRGGLAVALAVASLWCAPSAGAADVSVPLREAVASLPEAPESRAGYDRAREFGGWTDADHDGCNTRQEVLLEEAVQAPTVSGRCQIADGQWYSYYDDQYVTGPAGLDIDHMVPLAEAWDSGASKWPREQRVAYANDLSDPRHLVAVTARSNRQKADQDPAEWLRVVTAARCRYITEWTSVKIRWSLTVDPAEKQALTGYAAECPNAPVNVSPRA
ncbi:HNH endonuclease family protein [Streptomyces syringium]|uniref:HNH endonuclease family protein n=1 Tax=Streptomyces syringium TaxID=76729 RepID=UPI003D903E6E